MWSPTQNLGPIGSAVLTFIGYKQTDTQTSKVYYEGRYGDNKKNSGKILLLELSYDFNSPKNIKQKCEVWTDPLHVISDVICNQ